MEQQNFLQWLSTSDDEWWNDSAATSEIEAAIANGAVGATTNPILASRVTGKGLYEPDGNEVNECGGKAEARVRKAVLDACKLFKPVWDSSGGRDGYVCAQVNPGKAYDRYAMLKTARTYHSWSPQITVKLPANAAGLDVLEECTAEGIPTTMTVSFCVPQMVASAERHLKGCKRAEDAGITPPRSWAVIMIGRLDDYLRDLIADNNAGISEEDLKWAGVAATKEAYRVFKEIGARATIMVAALRGPHHVGTLLGGGLVFSAAPDAQQQLLEADLPRGATITDPVDKGVIDRLLAFPAFRRSYEPRGMNPEEFFEYGPFQRTATQFYYTGWLNLDA
ncbi:MAG: transaldolase family protein [Spirochaetaceae bacterium]